MMIGMFILLLGGFLKVKLISMIIIILVIIMNLWLSLILIGEMKEVNEMVLMDSLSLSSLILTLWICMMIFLVFNIWNEKIKNFMMMIMMSLIICFLMSNIFSFFIFFELVLIPMFIMVVLYGNYQERSEGGFYLLFYTLFGSVPLFLSVIKGINDSWSFMYMLLSKENIEIESVGSIMLISAFLMKLPMYGFHIWLPKAHVEAPVIGSMILAGVLLKLGGYGIMRVLFILNMNVNLKSLLMMMGLIGGINCGLTCLRQNDMKKLVAYSSVVHMGVMLSGGLTYMEEGMVGMLMMMISHGLCSSGMFFFVGIVNEHMKTRSILLVKGYGSLYSSSMLLCFLLVVMNMGCPPFLGVFSELLLVMSLMKWEFLFFIYLMMMMMISVGYNIYFYSMFCHGSSSSIIFRMIIVQEYLIFFLHLCPMLFLIFQMDSFFM